mmetsp:Transcript_64083/g.126650  ORF Transcript_64083/g.126650 Transcript_64083/m.126650 type:complete len:205 (+) Transcript_64083:218-832(+)
MCTLPQAFKLSRGQPCCGSWNAPGANNARQSIRRALHGDAACRSSLHACVAPVACTRLRSKLACRRSAMRCAMDRGVLGASNFVAPTPGSATFPAAATTSPPLTATVSSDVQAASAARSRSSSSVMVMASKAGGSARLPKANGSNWGEGALATSTLDAASNRTFSRRSSSTARSLLLLVSASSSGASSDAAPSSSSPPSLLLLF